MNQVLEFLRPKSSILIFFILCTFSTFIFLYLSATYFISHSEFWAIASARLLGETIGEAIVVYYKTFFYALLKIFYFFPMNNLDHIHYSRLAFGLLAATNLILLLVNIIWITGTYRASILYWFFLMTLQVYLCHAFRVRADVVSSLLILIFYSIVNLNYLKNKKTSLLNPVYLVLLTLAFLSTPKAVFLLFAFVIYSLCLNQQNLTRLEIVLFALIHLFFPLGLLLSISSLLFQTGVFVENPYTLALQYQINTTRDLFLSQNWSHVFLSLKANFFHYLLIISGYFIFFKNKELKNDRLAFSQVILSLLILVMTFIQAEKWPYFLAQMIPLIGLPALFVFNYFKKPYQSLIISLTLIATPMIMFIPQTLFPHNREQYSTISELEELFRILPEANYFDSVGALPRYPSKMWFLGPSDPLSRTYTLENIKREPTDFIFYTSKVDLASPEILTILHQNYFLLQNNIWILNKHAEIFKSNSPKLKITSLEFLFIYDYLPVTRF